MRGAGGGLVVLLLAERAPSEGPRSTREIEESSKLPRYLAECAQRGELSLRLPQTLGANGRQVKNFPLHMCISWLTLF